MNVASTAPRNLVAVTLLRLHRPVFLWLLAAMAGTVAVVVAGEAVFTGEELDDTHWQIWHTLASTVSRYGVLALGVGLVGVHLRAFVAHGMTRRVYLAGAILFGLATVVGVAVLVQAGYTVEQLPGWLSEATHTATPSDGGVKPDEYSHFSSIFAQVVRDAVVAFGYYLPMSLGYLVSGLLCGAVFYRFGQRLRVALLVPAMVPAFVAETLIGIAEPHVYEDGLLPHMVALPICLLLSTLGLVVVHRLLSDVAIRRTGG